MMSPADRLIYMANQIARNLAAQGDETAALMVADHIASFWDPRMKARLFAMDGAGLEPIAARAVAMLRADRTPQSQSAATDFASADSRAVPTPVDDGLFGRLRRQ